MTDGNGTTSPKVEFVWVLLTFSVIWNVLSTLYFARKGEAPCKCPPR